MTRVVLHVGPHKTGTSALQEFFVQNREVLRSASVIYPTEWQAIPPGHHELAQALLDADGSEREATLRSIADEVRRLSSAYDTILLSSETFARLEPTHLVGLRDALGDSSIEVVYFVRSWHRLVPSIWYTRVSHGSTITLPLHMLAYLMDGRASRILNYGLRLKDYASVFGRAGLRIVSYDQLQANGDDIAGFFITHVLGIDLPVALRSQRVNVSSAAENTEMIRALNVIAESDGVIANDRWPRTAYRRLVQNDLDARSVLDGLAAYAQVVPISAAPGAFRQVEASLLDEFGDRVVNLTDGRVFPLGAATSVRYIDADCWLDQDLRSGLERLYRSLPDRPAARS